MQFGRDNPTVLTDIKNPDIRILTSNISNSGFKIYSGASKFAEEEIIKNFYPPKTKPKDYLREYSKIFNSVELNSTRYGVPKQETLLKWTSDTPEDFSFATKVEQSFSHYSNLSLHFNKFEDFYNKVSPLLVKTGLLFLQLSEKFNKKREGELVSFIKKYSAKYKTPLAIEMRDSELIHSENLIDVLAKNNISMVITDTLGKRDILHANLTSEILMIRFVGNNLGEEDMIRLQFWKQLIEDNQRKLKAAYVFFHLEDKTKIIEARDMFETLNSSLDLKTSKI